MADEGGYIKGYTRRDGSYSPTDSSPTTDYKHGIQIYSSHDEKAIFQCCCESSQDRSTLLHTLESTISELRELEKEHMAELGTSMSNKPQEMEVQRRHRMASRAGDLLSSTHLNDTAGDDDLRQRRESRGDYVSGVGDLVISSTTTIIRRTSKSSGASSQPENRTSGGSHESGYDSQRTTPIPSPSPTNPPQPPPPPPPSSYFSPSPHVNPKRPLKGRESTTSAPMTLVTPANPVTRSKSTEHLHLTRVMTITPTLLSRDMKTKFSSVEDVRSNKSSRKSNSASNSPRTSKKTRTRSEKKSLLLSPLRFIGKHRESDPAEKRRPRTMSESPPLVSDLELSTQSVTNRASSYLVNTT